MAATATAATSGERTAGCSDSKLPDLQAGAESLQAIADYQEVAADAGLALQVLKAELAGLLFAGLAIAAAAGSYFATYAGALVRW